MQQICIVSKWEAQSRERDRRRFCIRMRSESISFLTFCRHLIVKHLNLFCVIIVCLNFPIFTSFNFLVFVLLITKTRRFHEAFLFSSKFTYAQHVPRTNYKYNSEQRCDRVYTKLVDIVYRVSCIVYTRTYTKFYKYTKIHTRNF